MYNSKTFAGKRKLDGLIGNPFPSQIASRAQKRIFFITAACLVLH
jgi:hypothetical protein